MTCVLDVNVLVRRFFPEIYSEEAVSLLHHLDVAFVPDFLWAELGSVLWQRVRSGEITLDVAQKLIEALAEFPCALPTASTQELLAAGLTIAVEFRSNRLRQSVSGTCGSRRRSTYNGGPQVLRHDPAHTPQRAHPVNRR